MFMVELLSPAGDFESLAAAIKGGANSIYFGIKWLNMRAGGAKNFDITDMKEIAKKCHENNVRCYVTLNTTISEHELDKIQKILDEVKNAKVDAVIASDFSVINKCFEQGIEVHISTQTNVSNYEAVKFFSKFSHRIVLARECTLEQIKSIIEKAKRDKLNMEIETFVHGAMCVAVSGRCFMSQYHNRRSANKGQCLQECRKQYKIIDIEEPDREFIIEDNYVMSPKDLCTLPILDKLVKTGIKVFKIEGRGRSSDYVYTTAKVYSEALKKIEKGKWLEVDIKKGLNELNSVYNRGLSIGFYLGTPTNDSWSGVYGSNATETKQEIGKVTNYYSDKKVAVIELINGELKTGDDVSFVGKTTGYFRTKVDEIHTDKGIVKNSKKGDIISVKVDEKVRVNDKVFVIRENKDRKKMEIISDFELKPELSPGKHRQN